MLHPKGKKIKLLFYIIIFILFSTQITKNQKNVFFFSTKINHIEVIGLSKKNNIKVFNNLSSFLLENIFFIKKDNFKKILEQNNLVESFYVKKIYPSVIKVFIKRTDLLAITNKNNKKFYIGSNGKLIFTEDLNNINKKLPFVFSKSNYNEFINLKNIIDNSDFQFEEIIEFYYFPSNRWDIKTNTGLLIKLPEKNILDSLKFANIIKTNDEFKDKKVIDLRISNNIIISDE